MGEKRQVRPAELKAEDRSWWDFASASKKVDARPAIPPYRAPVTEEESQLPPSTAGYEVRESFMDTIRMVAWRKGTFRG